MFLLFAHICIERTKSQRRHIHFGLVSARKLNEFIIHKLIWVIAEKRRTVNGDIAQFSWITKIECAIHLHNIYIYISIGWLFFVCLHLHLCISFSLFLFPALVLACATPFVFLSVSRCFSFSIYSMGVFRL